MKIAIVCSPGVGDLVIMQIMAHHLQEAGFEIEVITPHRFGMWLSSFSFKNEVEDADAVILQHGNDERSFRIKNGTVPIYTFYGAYQKEKHGPWNPGFDFVCDLKKTVAENVLTFLSQIFFIKPTFENGFTPLKGICYRKHLKRVVIHTTSQDPFRNWPLKKFKKVFLWLEQKGYEPEFLPLFESLEALTSYLYESGYFVGNDSGPGHIASALKIPNLIIGKEKKHMMHWKPFNAEVALPPDWIPNMKGLRLRERYWKSFISSSHVISLLEERVLRSTSHSI